MKARIKEYVTVTGMRVYEDHGDVKVTEPPKNYSMTGCGKRLPTQYMVRYLGRWRRVYAICYSNVASLYIRDKNAMPHGRIYVDID